MTATFQSLRDKRLPKTLHAIGLLENLVRYAHDEQEAKDLVNAVRNAADKLDAVFTKKWRWSVETIDTPRYVVQVDRVLPRARDVFEAELTYHAKNAIPSGTAEGGADFESEIRWAIDAIQRRDLDLAKNRLTRILKGQRT